MEYLSLFDTLSKYGNLNKYDKTILKEKFKPFTAHKKEILLNSENKCNVIYFIHQGLIRAFYKDEEEHCFTRTIAWENRFLTNIRNFIEDKTTNEHFECIEHTKGLKISKNDFFYLLNISSNLKSIYADLISVYSAFQIKRFEHLSLNSTDRYIFFLKNYPELQNRLTDEILASFLHMSTKTLERAKKNYLKL